MKKVTGSLLGCSRGKEIENEGKLGGPVLKDWNGPRRREKERKEKTKEAG
jgi:hypothetical protein